MTFSILTISIWLPLFVVMLASGCVAHTTERPSSQTPKGDDQSAITQNTKPQDNSLGIIVHIDPQTGRIITPPSTPPSGQVPQPPLETAKPPLPQPQETLSPVPGGGVMIELDDRFRTPLTATIDADGKVRFEHKDSVSGANDKE